MSEMQPALTAEEWDEESVSAVGFDGWIYGDGLTWLDRDYTSGRSWRAQRHAVAALALHGQPFGVRYEMADAISRAIAGKPLSEGDLDWLRTAVRVILSLLPPRGSDEGLQVVRGDKE